MAFQIVVNILMAVIWIFLQSNYTATSFIVGYMIGILILFMLRRFLVSDFYVHQVWAIIKLIMLFIIELIKANIDVIKVVLRPKLNHQPGIVAVTTRLESDAEKTLLARTINFNPGTKTT